MNKIDFIILFDALDANPNGDPDMGNMPRVDGETENGLVTDVCIKRKIRNFVQLTQDADKGFDIYVKEKAILNQLHDKAYADLGIDIAKDKKEKKDTTESEAKARAWMCEHFFDIRAFGAVMTTGTNCGQVRGPVQFSFARSISPVTTNEYAVTRCAVTKEEDAAKERTIGRKFTVPYALYMAKGTINPFLAKDTGFGEADLEVLKAALINLFEFDASAARPAGSMAMRRVIFFKHDSELGNAPAHKLFESVKVTLKDDVEFPRSIEDYDILPKSGDLPEGLPAGITVEELI